MTSLPTRAGLLLRTFGIALIMSVAIARPADAATVATAPSDVVASAGDQTATITWTAPSDMGTGAFRMYQVVSQEGQLRCTSSDETLETCDATGLTNEKTYYFFVRALTADGPGAWSAVSNAVVPGPNTASAPPYVTVRAYVNAIGVFWAEPSRMGTGTFVRYEVQRADGTPACTSDDSAVRQCLASNLPGGTSYQFKVRAVTGDGDGAWSALTSPLEPKSVPTAPGSITAKAGNQSATVTWTAPSSMGTGTFTKYEVYSHDGVLRCTSTVETTRTCKASGLQNNRAYRFFARAVTTDGPGAWSAASNAVTPSLLALL